MSEFTDEKIIDEATRGVAYGLLASVYNQLPSPDFLARVRAEEVRALFQPFILNDPASEEQRGELERGLQTVEEFWEQAGDLPEEELLVRLGTDRTRLFRGLNREGPPPPYEAVRKGSQTVMTEDTRQIAKAYAEFGYSDYWWLNEVPDYIGIELDFLCYLCIEAAKAWKAGDRSRALTCRNAEREFLCSHVQEWVPEFCDEVIDRAKEDLYRGMARVTKAFILIEGERLWQREKGSEEGGDIEGEG